MKNKTIFWLLAYVGVGYGAYYFLTKKKRDANTISKSGKVKAEMSWLLSTDSGYLSAWARAIRKKNPEFEYKGKTYLTNGGRVKK